MKSLIFLLPFFLLPACKKKKAPVEEQPPAQQQVWKQALSKGTNLSNWFNDYSDAAQFSSRFSPATLSLIKQNGFTYVRIPVGAEVLFDPANPLQLKQPALGFVDMAVTRCINAGLSVTINLHPLKNDTDSLLANTVNYVDKVAAYWKTVASFFKKYPADKLFFEVYNEPHASSAGLTTQAYSWWQPVQEKLVKAIREATPDHYIIAGGEGWNSIAGLVKLQPYTITKVVYNFHFYDPFLFTHQGASWAGWYPAMVASNVPYPSSPAGVAPLIAATSDIELKNNLQWYGDQRYNKDSLDKWIKFAADWAERYQVPLISNEFGSYKPFAPVPSRLNYIKDVRETMEKYHIGWAMWECDEDFGWISYPAGDRNNPQTDAAVLTALGLK